MKNFDYYTADRDPSRGGLRIVDTNESFPAECEEFITSNSLELISSDHDCRAVSVYPMGNGQAAISMSCMIPGNRSDSRPHEIIRGFLIKKENLASVCAGCLPEKRLDEFFFPPVKTGDGEMEEWRPSGIPQGTDSRLGHFWKQLGPNGIAGFHNAVVEVIKKRRKIQLIVPKGSERLIQAACYSVLEPDFAGQLYTISNGECTMSDADILLTDQIWHQNPRKYRAVTLSEFIKAGNALLFAEASKKREEVIDNAVEKCTDYIKSPYGSEQILCEVRRSLMEKSESDCREFQGRLRLELEHMRPKRDEMREYMQVLYLAYENYLGECRHRDYPLLPMPYDIQGILSFLKIHSDSKREFRRYLREFIGILLDNLELFGHERIVKNAGKQGEKTLLKYWTEV